MNLFIFLLIFNFANIAYSTESTCHQHKTCGECISHQFERCNWCSEFQEKDISSFRCQPESHKVKNPNWCKEDNVFPKKSNNRFINDSFSSTIQIMPQQLYIITTPGVEKTFDLSYQPASDFPLDVYFLMDYSGTMNKHREMLKEKSLQIYESLYNMTQNVVLGIGGFVEKPGWPYTDVAVTKDSTYVFRNYLNLTSDKNAIKNAIDVSDYGNNYDDAEAGLDALMQVMACDKKLGWRKDTRRIIVLATDNTYHSAGDGKMLGAIKHNDMQCHLANNEYQKDLSLEYDYPSVSQINAAAKKGGFLIIFAAHNKVKTIYEHLSKHIAGSSYAELNDKDSNIFEIIKDAYYKSVREGKIVYSGKPSSFEIKIDQNCGNSSEKNCFITPNKPNITIPITIKGTTCTKKETLDIGPAGLQEKFKLIVQVDCHCSCEGKSSNDTRKSCNDHGVLQCGACKCDEKWGGDNCNVSCDDTTSTQLKQNCYPDKNLTNSECSGHGMCECGKCKCADRFTGTVCEFDPNSCNSGINGQICSGDARGVCQYGNCTCIGDWEGPACDCPVAAKSKKLCTGPFSKKVCSGRGTCECGKCKCIKVPNSEDTYTGLYCDFCKECGNELCQKFEGYAKCNHNKTKEICDKEFKITTEINLEVLVANKSELIYRDEWKTGTLCRSFFDDGSSLLFKYNAIPKTDNTLIMIQKEIEITLKADLLLTTASIIAAVLLIGLLTAVFWKVFTEWHDKREYNKFCYEAKAQGFDVSQNPLYEAPTQNFVNPGFNQNI